MSQSVALGAEQNPRSVWTLYERRERKLIGAWRRAEHSVRVHEYRLQDYEAKVKAKEASGHSSERQRSGAANTRRKLDIQTQKRDEAAAAIGENRSAWEGEFDLGHGQLPELVLPEVQYEPPAAKPKPSGEPFIPAYRRRESGK